ncbi:MAG TPA: glycosyltransferase [Candidatus Limnocylindria bacterium]|nr:glycosyltransferase [Candidatus Limnocylindria bacterium]
MLFNPLYYQLKPFLPWRIRLASRRALAARQRARFADTWPINETAGAPPEGWPGWPEGKKFSVVLTHDVEGPTGLERCRKLMQFEMDLGFRSSFNFIPEAEYSVLKTLRYDLAANGFEVGVHDLRHDGKLFRSRAAFKPQASRINHYLREWKAVGFRSGFMLRNLDWIHHLDIEYDTSTFDTDPFEPQPEGVGTVFPFCVANANGGSYVELPYTLAQDSTLFIYLQERTPQIWKQKLDWIARHGGMVLLNTHPDYMAFDGSGRSSREYPVAHYREFLEYLNAHYRGSFWPALPREVAAYCKQHSSLKRVSRKRICMLSYSAYESDNRVMRYAEALAARGDTVDVLALQAKPEQPRSEELAGVHLSRIQKRIGKNEKGKISYLFRLLKFCFVASLRLSGRHFVQPYDLIHVHNIPDFLVFAAWLPKLTGAKVILDVHDIVPEFYASKFNAVENGLLFKSLRTVERCSASFAHHVIVSNHLWHQKLVTRSVSTSKSSVFLNHVDLQVFVPHRRTRNDGKLIIIFPGGLHWHQGVDIAIRAFAQVSNQLPKAEFHIYGQGSARNELIALVASFGLEQKVRFFENVPLTEIAEVIANADIGVVPKRADSFGNEAYSTKILEFMSQGIPVIASRTKIDTFYFNDDIVSFFRSGDAEDLAQKILAVARDSGLRDSLVRNAREYVVRNNWQTKKQDYLQLVDSLSASTERNGHISLPASRPAVIKEEAADVALTP